MDFIFRCGPILASYFLIYFANRIYWGVPTDTYKRGRDTLWYAIFPCFSGVRSKKSRTLRSTSGTRRNYWILTIKDAQIKPGQCVLTILEVDLLIYFASEIYKQKPAKAGFWVLSSSPYCTRLNRPAWRVRIFNAHALQSRNYRQNAYILPYKYL